MSAVARATPGLQQTPEIDLNCYEEDETGIEVAEILAEMNGKKKVLPLSKKDEHTQCSLWIDLCKMDYVGWNRQGTVEYRFTTTPPNEMKRNYKVLINGDQITVLRL